MKTKNKILGLLLFVLLTSNITFAQEILVGPYKPLFEGKVLNIPTSAFDYDPDNCGNVRGSYIADNSPTFDCGIAIPLLLSSGSEIIDITVTVASGEDDVITIYMQSMDMNDASMESPLALLMISGSTSGISKETVTLGTSTVRIERDKSYQIIVSLAGDSPTTGLPRIYGVSITYK